MKRAKKLTIKKEVDPKYAAEIRQMEDQLESDKLPPVDPNFETTDEIRRPGLMEGAEKCQCGGCVSLDDLNFSQNLLDTLRSAQPTDFRPGVVGTTNPPARVYDPVNPRISDQELLEDMLQRHEEEINAIEASIDEAKSHIDRAEARRAQLLPRIASIKSSLAQF